MDDLKELLSLVELFALFSRFIHFQRIFRIFLDSIVFLIIEAFLKDHSWCEGFSVLIPYEFVREY